MTSPVSKRSVLKLAGWAAQPETHPALPEEDLQTLTRLARLGHARGLHEALDQLRVSQPDHGAEWAALRELVERFDFAALLERLQRGPALPAAGRA